MSQLLQLLQNHPEQINSVIALLAMIASLISIMLTISALYIQRQHNYKSVTPIASFPIGDYEGSITVKLKSTGVGPLLIETLRVTDGKHEKTALISWMPELPSGVN
jgi:hypothetical protein